MFSVSRITQCLILVALVPIAIFGASWVWQQSNPERGTLHILAIGISKYEHYKADEVPAFAAKDAREFTDALKVAAHEGFGSITTHLLVDENATRAAIGQTIEQLRADVKPEDTFVFFYSGHGMTRTLGLNKEEQFYLIPYNFNPAFGKSELSNKGIASVLLQSWLLSIPAQRQFVVLNSSKSGRGFEGFVSRSEEDNKFLGADRRDIAVLFNNAGSYELDKFENGLLPYLVIEALKAGETTVNGVLTTEKVIEYVEQNARAVIKKAGNTATPRILTNSPNSGMPSIYRSGKDFLLGSKSDAGQINPPGATLFNQPSFIRPNTLRYSRSRQNRALATDPVVTLAAPPQEDENVFILPPECASLSEVRASTATFRKGKDHALLFGTDLYDNWTTLNNPASDATALAGVLNTRFGFETEVVKNASKKCISQFLAKYRSKKYKDDEQLLIFFAGHGTYRSNYDGFLIARDSAAVNLDPGGDSWIAHTLISRVIDGIPCKHILLVLDSCFGGAMASAVSAINEERNTSTTTVVSGSDSDTLALGPDTELIRTLLQFRTRRFLTSGGKEYVSDGAPGSHSPFANKLLSAFETNPQNRTFFTVSEIIPKVKFANPYQPIILYDSWPSNESRSEFFFFISSA